jgi:hypothetical protein
MREFERGGSIWFGGSGYRRLAAPRHARAPTRASITFERLLLKKMGCRALATPKGLRPRRRVEPGNDELTTARSNRAEFNAPSAPKRDDRVP